LQVLEQAIELEDDGPDLVLRWAAVLHDVGKPRTRQFVEGGRVTFHHHEVVGAKMARKRLKQLRYPTSLIEDVGQLVFLHLRFYGYRTSDWTDSAVRRYVVDAGSLLPRLHKLVRSDCTTRNKRKAADLASAYAALEQRIAELQAKEELDAIRPDLDGNQIMSILGVPAGPVVGEAYRHLLALRMEHGPLGPDRATEELKAWHAARS
jgi:poly(A) polymerase